MKKWIAMPLWAASLSALAACGGGSSGSDDPLISAEEDVLRVFADADGDGNPDQDAADVLARGDMLVARRVSSTSWQENYNDGMGDAGSYAFIDGVLSLEGDGDDLLVSFPYNGSTTTIRIVNAATIDTNSVTISDGGIFFDFFIGSGGLTIADLLDDSVGQGYAHRVGVYYNDGTELFGSQTEAIIGAETRDSMIDELETANATVSYDGFGSIRIRYDDADWNTFNANLDGDLSMSANFGSGTISGEMSNLFLDINAGSTDIDSYGVDGSLLMDETSIEANAFSGSISADATLASGDEEVTGALADVGYSRAFYGDAAQEIGGVVQGSGSYEGQGYLVEGAFIGDAIIE